MHPVDNKPTSKKITEHRLRMAWNEQAVKNLGLQISKEHNQIKTISVTQGNYNLFHAWSARGGQQENYDLHVKLEKFLKAYIEHVKNFPGANDMGTGDPIRFIPNW